MRELLGFFGAREKQQPTTPEKGTSTNRDLALATAAILSAAASSDQSIDKKEAQAIATAIQSRLGISSEKCSALMKQVEGHESTKLEKFVAEINAQFGQEERVQILALAWKVIMADGVITTEEGVFSVTLRKSLNLSMEQALRARKLSEGLELDGFKESVEASEVVREKTREFGKPKS